jgi:hypothetical protein
MSKTISSKLPAATLSQRLASMSLAELMFAARELAKDTSKDMLCTAVLDELEKRSPGQGFDSFVTEIYS